MPVGKGNIFPSERRLRSRSEFTQAWNKGRKYHSDHFLVIVVKKAAGPTRLGVTASRKVGGAVQRNRIKRLVREFFRIHYSQLPGQTDISVVAKKNSAQASYDEVCSELRGLLTG